MAQLEYIIMQQTEDTDTEHYRRIKAMKPLYELSKEQQINCARITELSKELKTYKHE